MGRFWKGVLAGVGLMAILAGASMVVFAQQDGCRPRDWLLCAADDSERWTRLQDMFGGFAPAMTEVGYHYERTFELIAEGNLEYARWQWDRVSGAIQLGYLRRPDRQPNADAIFLDTVWVALDQALANEDADAARDAFVAARAACMACHVAEARPYFNDQRLFRETAVFPPR